MHYHPSPLLLYVAFAIAVVCCGCTGFNEKGHGEESWSQQVAAVQAGTSYQIDVRAHEVSDADVTQLAGSTGLRQLRIDRSRLTDNGLLALADATQLKVLTIRGRPIGDQGLAHICSLGHLERLNLPHTRITDAGLLALHNLPKLELLRMGSPELTDEGLAGLRQLTSLRFLHLIDVPITDKGLLVIQEFAQLESFYLDGGQVTDDGLWNLVQARPNLHIHRDQQHHDRDQQKTTHAH